MKLDILAFAAHPDDIELSASGTLMKHISEGKKVGIVDLTQGELGSRGSVELRYEEAAKASSIMGIHARENLKMADGFFEHNQENLIKIIEQVRRFKPEIVLANSIRDRHPDHGRASKLVAEACFYAGLRKIETTWEGEKQEAYRPKAIYFYIQDEYIEPDFVVDISAFVGRKLESIMAYSSQFYDPNSKEPKTPISGEEFLDFMKGRMRQFGRPIGVDFAEGFVKHRTVGVKNLFDLI
jgi:N-acetylglucosamine malate deacetylase 1